MKKSAHAARINPAQKPEADPGLPTGAVAPKPSYDSTIGRVRPTTKRESDPMPAVGA